jgi:hypothetical protein
MAPCHIGVDVEPPAAIAVERDEVLRLDVIARLCQRYHERLSPQRVHQLPTVRMIIGPPNETARA